MGFGMEEVGAAGWDVTGGCISAMRRLLSRLRCLVTNVLITCAASLAELLPQFPCSQRTATTISGLRRGAIPTNHALGSVLWPPPLRLSASWLMTWAVPVLPAKSTPSRCAMYAVPIGLLVTLDIASVMSCQFSVVRGMVV